MQRRLWQQHKTTKLAISTSKLALRGDGGQRASVWPWPLRAGSGSPLTNVPPTSPARTTSRVRARCPTRSGYARSFLRVATAIAAPPTLATLARADPSQCKTDTSWCRLPAVHPQTVVARLRRSPIASAFGQSQGETETAGRATCGRGEDPHV